MGHDAAILGAGLLLGFLSGLFGVGGSSVATPVLRLLGVPALVALATPLPVTIPVMLAGGASYWRRGMVQFRIAAWTAAAGAPAVVVGSYLSTVIPGRALMAATGAAVLAAGVRLLRTRPGPETAHPTPEPSRLLLLALGAGVGLLSGLLANGGGFLLMPAFLLLLRLPPAQAAATSLVSAGALALPGTYVHWRLGHVDPALAALLSVVVIPSSLLGAHLGARLSPSTGRRLFGWFLVLFGAFFLARTLYRIETLGWF